MAEEPIFVAVELVSLPLGTHAFNKVSDLVTMVGVSKPSPIDVTIPIDSTEECSQNVAKRNDAVTVQKVFHTCTVTVYGSVYAACTTKISIYGSL
jgi:hypothetical protein